MSHERVYVSREIYQEVFRAATITSDEVLLVVAEGRLSRWKFRLCSLFSIGHGNLTRFDKI
jgi:hypothetical protein